MEGEPEGRQPETPISLAKPEIGPEEERLVIEVLRSGRLSLGPMLEQFEREFADWLGVEDAIATNSGTTALHLGVRALCWGEGSEVVLSPFTFVASANCLLYEGVRPVFADVDPTTLNLIPQTASAAVGPDTAGILPIDIFGYPCDMPGFEALAERKGLRILEDAAQALGAVDSEGRRVGSRGNLAAFAFYANKQMTTGEGGMIIPRDPEEAERIRSERNQGRAVDMDWLDHDRLGFNYRLSDVAAAIGLAQVRKLDDMLAAREGVAALYESALSGLEEVERPISGHGQERRSWFVYPVRLPEAVGRDEVIERLALDGVPAKAYLPCVHLFPHLRALGYGEGDFPVAEAVSARSLALPFHTSLSEAEVNRVAEALERALGA
jgi:perosamine synthetase